MKTFLDRVVLENGAEVSTTYVPSTEGDFGCASLRARGVDATIHPIRAEQCARIAAMFSDLAARLRAAEEDRAKFLAAVSADEASA